MKIEILYTPGCPNVDPVRALLEQILSQRRLAVAVNIVQLADERAAAQVNFAGSPTVLINGQDVEPGPRAGFACRLYPGGRRGPSREAMERAIERAATEERT